MPAIRRAEPERPVRPRRRRIAPGAAPLRRARRV